VTSDPHELDSAPISVLFGLLMSTEARERSDAACALGDRLRTREVRELDTAVREKLAELLHDKVLAVRIEAAIALAEARDVRATPILLSALHRRELRLDAMRALGTMGDVQAIAELTRFLKGWLVPWADRLQAAAALCALGDSQGASYLKAKLESRNPAERAAATHFIGECGHPEALQLLGAIVANPGHGLRDTAVRALAFVGHEARPLLEAARAHADSELLEDIENALAEVARREEQSHAAP
jgi:HEAT repeat protein